MEGQVRRIYNINKTRKCRDGWAIRQRITESNEA